MVVYFFNSFFLRGMISKIVALEAVLMCPGRPTYSILFSNYPVKDLLMAFMYFEYVPQSFSFSCICSYVCIHMSKSKRYAFVKSVRPACKLWTGKDQFFWCMSPQEDAACPVPLQDLQWFPFAQRTKGIHGCARPLVIQPGPSAAFWTLFSLTLHFLFLCAFFCLKCSSLPDSCLNGQLGLEKTPGKEFSSL